MIFLFQGNFLRIFTAPVKNVMALVFFKSLITSFTRAMTSESSVTSCSSDGDEFEGVIRLGSIEGLPDRHNDVLFYPSPDLCSLVSLVVYFGGDVQDYSANMLQHRDNKHHIRWSLENTTILLHKHFPKSHIFVIRPSAMHLKTFSCYNNFVDGNDIGVPKHDISVDALKHLSLLLKNASVAAAEAAEHSSDVKNKFCATLAAVPIIIIGFSKGCVVLNQLLYSFKALLENPDHEVDSFAGRIKDIYWLDGGHSGGSNTWITKEQFLKPFAARKIDVFIHVTPYQVKCEHRPWIGKEEKAFRETLKRLNVHVTRVIHFEEQVRSLEMHFKILEVFK